MSGVQAFLSTFTQPSCVSPEANYYTAGIVALVWFITLYIGWILGRDSIQHRITNFVRLYSHNLRTGQMRKSSTLIAFLVHYILRKDKFPTIGDAEGFFARRVRHKGAE